MEQIKCESIKWTWERHFYLNKKHVKFYLVFFMNPFKSTIISFLKFYFKSVLNNIYIRRLTLALIGLNICATTTTTK